MAEGAADTGVAPLVRAPAGQTAWRGTKRWQRNSTSPALETSFDLVAGRREELVDRFYRRLFNDAPATRVDDAPATRALFAHADMRAQKRALLGALVALRRSLRDLSAIAPFLADLGARHARDGVSAEHSLWSVARCSRRWPRSPVRRGSRKYHRVERAPSDGRPDHDRRRRPVRSRSVTTRPGSRPCRRA